MQNKTVGILGISITATFIIGFLCLFIINPLIFSEINNLSIVAYNLEGMTGRTWCVIIIYLTIGLLNILFCISLLISWDDRSSVVAGKILLLLCGIIWLTFGLFRYDPQTNLGTNLLLMRIIVMVFAGSMGLLIIGSEFNKISSDKFLKLYTLISGLSIMALSILSIFFYNDDTWIRTNISLTLYFVWFGVFGMRFLKET